VKTAKNTKVIRQMVMSFAQIKAGENCPGIMYEAKKPACLVKRNMNKAKGVEVDKKIK
jgi:cyclic lactone autoinducer peptide